MALPTPVISYYWDGYNIFTTYSVNVSATRGILDVPKMKDVLKYSWPDQPGESVDLTAPQFDPKEFSMDFWIQGTTLLDCQQKMNTFIKALILPIAATGTHRLQIDVDSVTPLVYQVYCPEGVSSNIRFNPASRIISFTVKFREPEPVKRVYRWTAVPYLVGFSMVASKPINFYWGDATMTADQISDTVLTINHTYTTTGTKYIIITGDLAAISYLSTTATLVCDKLL